MLNRIFWFINFYLVATFSSAGDWSQWFHSTPGKNMISNESMIDRHRNVFTCSENRYNSVHYLEKWYFYKGNIIGSFENNQPAKYFIINENNCSIDSFSNEIEFKVALSERKLKPLIWERWFDDNWGFFFEGDGLGGPMDWFFMRGSWLILPGVFMLVLALMLKKIRNKYGRLICSGIAIITAIRVILDLYPMSL